MCAGYERDPDCQIARIGCFHFHPYVINPPFFGALDM